MEEKESSWPTNSLLAWMHAVRLKTVQEIYGVAPGAKQLQQTLTQIYHTGRKTNGTFAA